MTDNMELWNKVSTTDPTATKRVNQRGGFTAIDAYSQIMAATGQFGPAGEGWGWEIMEFQYPPNDTVIVHLRLWHMPVNPQLPPSSFSVCGQAALYSKGADPKPDADCAKKAVTDAITKGLSYLGFNADVFLGKFDNNKYVESLKDEQKGKPSDNWHGPLNITSLKEQLRKLSGELDPEVCTDETVLDGIVKGYATIMNQASRDLPDWHQAAVASINAKRTSFKDPMGAG